MASKEAYITGVGQSEVGVRLTRHPLLLTIDAVKEALDDAGLTLDQIDGVSTYPGKMAGVPGFSPVGSEELADALGIKSKWHMGGGELPDQPVYDLALTDWASRLEKDDQGNWLVPLFGDLKRHRIADQRNPALGNELLAQRFVDRDVFQTAELWGIASTAPYGHRGDMVTLDEVIRAHGGDAEPVTKAYKALEENDRSALIAFLKTLVIE